MAETKPGAPPTAEPGHDEGFGPVCLYNGRDPHVCNTQEELDEYIDKGWQDAPSDTAIEQPEVGETATEDEVTAEVSE